MKVKNFCLGMLALFLVLVLANIAFAAGSGAFRVEIPDGEALGKGSAFAGEADNPSAVYYNPSGITQLKGQAHLSVGLAPLHTKIERESFGGDTTQMRQNMFLIPHTYFVSDFNIDGWAFGVGTGSNWGTGTDWADDSFSRYVATKSELTNIDSMVVAAYEINESLSLGAGAIISHSKVSKQKKLLQDSGSFSDGGFQIKGDDTGYGYTLSGLYKLSSQHQFGLQYRSPIELKYRGRMSLDNLQGTYASVFGGSTFTTDITSELELPQSVILGYSFTPNDKWRFNFDVEWFDWSKVERELLVYEAALTGSQSTVLNTGNPAPRDWDDAFSAAVGAEYNWSDRLRLRGGYYFHERPVNERNLESTLPDANSHGMTMGFGYDIHSDLTLDMAYSILIYENDTIDNAAGSAFGGDVDGEYENMVNMAGVTVNYRFGFL